MSYASRQFSVAHRSYGPEYPFKEDSDQDDDKHLHRSDINPPASREGDKYGEDAHKNMPYCLDESEDSEQYASSDTPEIEADQNQYPAELDREVSELLKAWTRVRD